MTEVILPPHSPVPCPTTAASTSTLTLATAGVAESLAAANNRRSRIVISNYHASAYCSFRFAVAGGLGVGIIIPPLRFWDSGVGLCHQGELFVCPSVNSQFVSAYQFLY